MWEPQHGPQVSAILADWVDEVFYGGERGGGKSDFQLGYQEDGALRYRDKWRGIMFRKTYAELEELQARAVEVFTVSGATFKTQASADFPFSNCWYWPCGAGSLVYSRPGGADQRVASSAMRWSTAFRPLAREGESWRARPS